MNAPQQPQTQLDPVVAGSHLRMPGGPCQAGERQGDQSASRGSQPLRSHRESARTPCVSQGSWGESEQENCQRGTEQQQEEDGGQHDDAGEERVNQQASGLAGDGCFPAEVGMQAGGDLGVTTKCRF